MDEKFFDKFSAAEVARVLKSLPRTADGKVMYIDATVCRIHLTSGGVVGFTREKIRLLGKGEVLFYEWAGMTELKGKDLFSTRAAALAECRKRNRGGK